MSLTFGKLSGNVREGEPETAELSFPDRGLRLTIIYRGKSGRLRLQSYEPQTLQHTAKKSTGPGMNLG